MRCAKWLFIVFILVGILGGCGLKEGVVQKDPKSYLWFTGNTENAIVSVDDLNPIDLSKKFSSAEYEKDQSAHNKERHYEISPGKHKIIVKRAGVVVVDRIVLLGGGITKEIKIP